MRYQARKTKMGWTRALAADVQVIVQMDEVLVLVAF
jgi:hypothetical protein